MVFAELALLAQLILVWLADQNTTVVAKVNGTAITAADLEFAATQQGRSAETPAADDPKLLDELIDNQLIRSFLAAKKVVPVADELQYQITRVEDLIRKRGEDPEKLLAKLGYTSDRLKSVLGLPLAWQVYARQTITPDQIKTYYNEHKQELDGTQLRGRQIFLKLSDVAELPSKKTELTNWRRDILDKKTTFEDAAKAYSEAPSREKGGDVGLFGWRGKLPAGVSDAAFQLKVGEISEPIVTQYGVHLVQVTERHPGDLSLEDVRPVILDRLSQQLRTALVAKERATAKIERTGK